MYLEDPRKVLSSYSYPDMHQLYCSNFQFFLKYSCLILVPNTQVRGYDFQVFHNTWKYLEKDHTRLRHILISETHTRVQVTLNMSANKKELHQLTYMHMQSSKFRSIKLYIFLRTRKNKLLISSHVMFYEPKYLHVPTTP